MLAFDVTFTILDNNTDAENIYQLINNLITLPGFRENTTCAVARLFANEDFGQIEGNLRRLEDMVSSDNIGCYVVISVYKCSN